MQDSHVHRTSLYGGDVTCLCSCAARVSRVTLAATAHRTGAHVPPLAARRPLRSGVTCQLVQTGAHWPAAAAVARRRTAHA